MADNNIMGWDDALENDGEEYVVLPEGDYDFTVTNFERGSFPGSAKIPPCNKAVLTLTVEHEGRSVNVRADLILYRTLDWKLSSFFRCIGLKKRGERIEIHWDKVTGCTGRAHFKPRQGSTDVMYNDVDRYLDPDQYQEVSTGETPWGDDF